MIDEGADGARRTDPRERLGRPALEGPPARRDRRRQHLRGVEHLRGEAGNRQVGREGRADARDRPRHRVRIEILEKVS